MNKAAVNPNLSSVTERVLSAAGVVVFTAASFVVAWFNPVTAGFFPQCPLYRMTGLACPGCGLTRGFHALFHGDILTALDYNALIPLYALLFAYIFLSMLLIAVRGRGLGFGKIPQKMLWSFLFIGLAFAVLRNLPYYPFNILYP
jgi:Protein of unknown function (DUF2752).